jgi:hypothetical protein
VNDEPHKLKLSRLRGQLLELGAVVRQLHQAGRDSAAAQHLLLSKRAELEDALTRGGSDVS